MKSLHTRHVDRSITLHFSTVQEKKVKKVWQGVDMVHFGSWQEDNPGTDYEFVNVIKTDDTHCLCISSEGSLSLLCCFI